MARRFKDRPRPLGELMPDVYPSKEPDDIRAMRAFAWWDDAVPRRVAERARPVRLVRGVLTVHVATSAWAHELEFLRESLLASVQRRVPRAAVKDIRFRVGELPATLPRAEPPPPVEVIPARHLPEEVAKALAGVKDDALRDAVQKAARTSLGQRIVRKGKGER